MTWFQRCSPEKACTCHLASPLPLSHAEYAYLLLLMVRVKSVMKLHMLLMQILDVVALHLLFAALGFCQASRSAAARHTESAKGSVYQAGIPSAGDLDSIERPVLGEPLHTEH